MKYNEIHILDCSTDTEDSDRTTATEVVRTLKKKGFRAVTAHSPYVGYRAVAISCNTLLELRNALRVCKSYGYLHNIKEQLSDILDGLRCRSHYAGYVR